MPALNRLSPFLRAARERSGLSLRAVEESTGISNAYLSQLENGRIREPSPLILHKLSLVLDFSYLEAMQLSGYPVPSQGAQAAARVGSSRFQDVTPDEEHQLTEYLEFIRRRKGPGSGAR